MISARFAIALEANLASIPGLVPKVEIQDLIGRFRPCMGTSWRVKSTPATATLDIFL